MTGWRTCGLLAGIALFGAAKLPVERSMSADFHAAHFMQADLNRDVRAQSSQMEFVAALSGFRSIVGDLIWIRAYVAFEDTEWGRLKLLLDAATSLQPRNTEFWETAAWHMAWNASVAMLRNPNQPRETLRIKAAREYMRLGEDFYLRGIAFNPDSSHLYENLAFFYSQKMGDHARAALAYAEAARRPNAMGYVKREAVYEIAAIPGREAEALDRLRALYAEGPSQRFRTVLTLLDKLQKQLNVPADQRIDITEDLKAATPGRPQPPSK